MDEVLDYMRRIAVKVAWSRKGLQTLIESNMFDDSEPSPIIFVLSAFKLACVSNSIHDGAAAVFFLKFLWKTICSAGQNAHLRQKLESSLTLHTQKKNVAISQRVVNYHRWAYASDDFIAETYAAFSWYVHPSRMAPTENTESFHSRKLRYGDV